MSRFTIINTDMWMDKEVRAMTPTEKLVWTYLLTSPLGNAAGFYRLPEDQVEFTLGKDAATILHKPTKLYKYDAASEQVFITNYLKYNTAKSQQQMKGIASAVKSLERCELFIDFVYSMNRFCGAEALQYFDKRLLDYIRVISGQKDDMHSVVVNKLITTHINE